MLDLLTKTPFDISLFFELKQAATLPLHYIAACE